MKNPGHWWRKVEDSLINLLHCKIAQISLACIARISILGYSARRNNFSLFGCTNVGVCLQVYTRTSPLPLLQFYVMNHNILLIPSPILNLFLKKKIVSYVAINLQWGWSLYSCLWKLVCNRINSYLADFSCMSTGQASSKHSKILRPREIKWACYVNNCSSNWQRQFPSTIMWMWDQDVLRNCTFHALLHMFKSYVTQNLKQ